MSNKKGYSLIELIIIIAIIGIVTSVSFAYYNSFTQDRQLEEQTRKFIDVLELAKRKAQAGDRSIDCTISTDGLKGHQITFNSSTSYSLDIACTSGTRTIQGYTLPSGISFISHPAYLRFKTLLSGIDSGTGDSTISVEMQSIANNKCTIITITQNGLISKSPDQACVSPT